MPPNAMPYRQATVCRQQGMEYGQPSNLTPLEECAPAGLQHITASCEPSSRPNSLWRGFASLQLLTNLA